MLDGYESDYVASEQMEAILEMSRYESSKASAIAEPPKASAQERYLLKHETSARLSALDSEIKGVDEQIERLKALRQTLLQEKQDLMRQNKTASCAQSDGSSAINGKGKAKANSTIDYTIEFDWAPQLQRTMKDVFGISSFRLCQKGVCNANVDGRDIVCVMPTGGGKSLTYQLPALLMPGCTLVISPLISLITDQILHLNEAGVDAVMLTGGTSKARANEIQRRLISMVASRSGAQEKEIKLCYVTPEKIAKSKSFMSLLRKLVEGGKLARIVIDEAHCVSQLGHDFRPDYKKLGVLRQFFPHVPILGLSATCPPRVLQDILKILHMKPVVDGKAAPREGTVYFSAPLYRKNLHYVVVPKPSSSKGVISAMAEYIMQKHKNDSGIIYCLSKKDAETVAISLREESKGQIRTGVYHADVPDVQKEDLHRRWREGAIQVVCATIAFGLGIDKGNVRFVLHHTISKSLDGYYQESGRAGRDGGDADCILYYRPQDASRQAAITCSDTDGQAKLHDMLRFAQDMLECRKILFAKYFSASSDLSVASWATEESGAMDKCGHCDNCTRPAHAMVHQDVTLEAWQTLKIIQAIDSEGGRQTIAALGDLARGTARGLSGATASKGRTTKERAPLDFDTVAGGTVALTKEDMEMLIVHLLVSRYLTEAFSSTSYSVNAYVVPGELALRLIRLSRTDVLASRGPRIYCTFRRHGRGVVADVVPGGRRRGRGTKRSKVGTLGARARRGPTSPPRPEGVKEEGVKKTLAKRKRSSERVEASEEDEDEEGDVEDVDADGRDGGEDEDEGREDFGMDEDEAGEDFTHAMRMVDRAPLSDGDWDEDDGGGVLDWEYSLRPSAGTSKRQKVSPPVTKSPSKWANKRELDDDVISLSSD